MKTNLSLVLLAFSGLLLIHAGPSFRSLQETPTVVIDAPVNVTTNTSTNTNTNTSTPTNTTGNSTSGNSTSGNNTTPTTPTLPNPYPGYTAINTSDLDASWYNPQVFGAFKHGVNALVQTAIFQRKAPLAVYNVSEWIGAWSRNRSWGVSYRFYVTLRSPRNVRLVLNLTVNHYNRNNVNLLGAYNYRVLNIPRGSFPSDNYKYATPAQITNNTILQGALKFGAEWMIQWLVDGNKIPAQNLNYTMWALNLAVYRTERNGTSYRFRTENSNANGVRVDTNYTVVYNNADKSYNVTNYWYHGYNYSDSELNQTVPAPTNGTQNVTVEVNSTTVITGTETTTVNQNSTDVTGTAVVTVENTTTVNQTTTNTTTVVPETNVTVPETNVTVPAAKVNVDISYVIAYNDTETTTPLVNFNRPERAAEPAPVPLPEPVPTPPPVTEPVPPVSEPTPVVPPVNATTTGN